MTEFELLDLMERSCLADYIYRQLAEECCELGQAALKMVRRMCHETPEDAKRVLAHYLEELADVRVMWDLAVAHMNVAQADEVKRIMQEKQQRMLERLRAQQHEL